MLRTGSKVQYKRGKISEFEIAPERQNRELHSEIQALLETSRQNIDKL